MIDRALGLTRTHGQRALEAEALLALGEFNAIGDVLDPEQAQTSVRQALSIAEQLGTRPLIAHCHLGLGKLYRRTGKRELAHELLTTAMAMYREMDMRYWLDQAAAELKVLA